MPSELQQALADERAAHWTCVEMLRDLRAENERLREAIRYALDNLDEGLNGDVPARLRQVLDTH